MTYPKNFVRLAGVSSYLFPSGAVACTTTVPKSTYKSLASLLTMRQARGRALHYRVGACWRPASASSCWSTPVYLDLHTYIFDRPRAEVALAARRWEEPFYSPSRSSSAGDQCDE